ncbi:MAG: histidine phosphatase family protein [Acidocella sp.]|nr:histidine phosphatase family protein [Acidocella sp.]
MPIFPTSTGLGLVRHGATGWTQARRYQGRADPSLCAAGLAEMDLLSERLRATNITQIVSSPLQRSVQSAARLAAAARLAPLTIDPDLIELDYGDWEGMTQEEVKAAWPQALRQWKRTPETHKFPGGETLADAQHRVRNCLARWLPPSRYRCILLVTHSAWIRLAYLEAAGLPLTRFREIAVPTGALIWHPHPFIPTSPSTEFSICE